MGFRAVCPIPGGRYGDVEQRDNTLTARIGAREVWRRDLPAMPRAVTCVYFGGELLALCTQSPGGDKAVIFGAGRHEVLGKSHIWPLLWTKDDRLFATIVRDRNTWETLDVTTPKAPRRVVLADTPAGSDAISTLGIAYMKPDGTPSWRAPVDPKTGKVLAGYSKVEKFKQILLIPIVLADGTVCGQLKGCDWPTVAHAGGLSTLLQEPSEVTGCVLDDGAYVFAIDMLKRAGSKLIKVIPPAWPRFTTPDDTPDPDEDDDMSDERVTKLQAEVAALKERTKALESGLPSLDRTLRALEARVAALEQAPDTGGGDGGNGGGGEPEPPPDGEAPVIDPASVEWLGRANPLGFRVTSTITAVEITKKADDSRSKYPNDNWEIFFPHTKAGNWPQHTNPQGKKYEGNVCVFGRLGDRWYGDTCEWLEVNQVRKRLTNRVEPDSWGIGPHTKHDPLEAWGPKSGEWIGIMVCTPVRDGVEGDVNERSQIFMVRWP